MQVDDWAVPRPGQQYILRGPRIMVQPCKTVQIGLFHAVVLADLTLISVVHQLGDARFVLFLLCCQMNRSIRGEK